MTYVIKINQLSSNQSDYVFLNEMSCARLEFIRREMKLRGLRVRGYLWFSLPSLDPHVMDIKEFRTLSEIICAIVDGFL